MPGDAWASVDLSHVGLELGVGSATTALRRIGDALPDGARIQVGAEEAARTDAVLAVVLAAHRAGVALSATVQANLRSSPSVAARLAGEGVWVRLVKGAYVEDAALAHPYGPATDAAFDAIAADLVARGAALSLATHDPARIAAVPEHLPVEVLLGVRAVDARAFTAAGRHVRVYAPFGPAWFRYWMRRVAEAQGP